MTFFGEERWKDAGVSADGQRLPPARVAVGDDRADDHPGHRIRRCRCFPGHRRPADELAGPGRRRVRRAAPAGLAGSSSPSPPWSSSRSASLIAWLLVGRQPVPLDRPEKVSPVVRFARADAGGNAINEALVARPGLWLGHGAAVHRRPRRRRRGERPGRRPRRAVRRLAPLAERFRPLLRPVDARPGPSWSSPPCSW